MSALLLDGRTAADALLATIKKDVQRLDPKLVIVQVGDDPASASYIKQKLKSCNAASARIYFLRCTSGNYHGAQCQ
jgi:5,10-methylene-tetrahydrofolate dehydrogenase/methenyl tetrahydrofolate cyclohydrolase